ncbi:hypothetical protein HK098_000366 [Nowakowskiella sp. JEL0407]|nr:hypothetical protein HK098_000366 [Nowakowskiella sp. JEL0407]
MIESKDEFSFLDELRAKLENSDTVSSSKYTASTLGISSQPALNGSALSSYASQNGSVQIEPNGIDTKSVESGSSTPTQVGSNEVISNFFQSLLTKKSTATTVPGSQSAANLGAAAAQAAATLSMNTSRQPKVSMSRSTSSGSSGSGNGLNNVANPVQNTNGVHPDANSQGYVQMLKSKSSSGNATTTTSSANREKLLAQMAALRSSQERQAAELKALKEDDV